MKDEGIPSAFEKYSFIFMPYNDSDHGFITQAPTRRRSSHRLLLCWVARNNTQILFSADFTQAYPQSNNPLVQPISLTFPLVLIFPADLSISLDRPLYGVIEANRYWNFTFRDHHTSQQSPTFTTHDRCLLYTKHLQSFTPSQSMPRRITCLKTDDTASTCNQNFYDN